MAKILIVEDNNDFRDVVKNILQKQFADLEIFQALTAEAGLGLAAREKPEVILMDIHLPNMNGMEAAKLIQEKVAGCKIIILTMFANEDVRKMCLGSDVEEVIGKNELYQKLIPTVKRLINPEGEEK